MAERDDEDMLYLKVNGMILSFQQVHDFKRKFYTKNLIISAKIF